MTNFQSCIPLPLEEKQLLEIVEKAKDWALMHGVAMRPKANYSPDALQFAPFILTPSPFPRQEFERSVRLQTILNELMHWVAYDYEFLEETLESTIQVDEFTRNLFNIHKRILEDKDAAQGVQSLGLCRSDYMIHSGNDHTIKQVEFNTIASSFGGITKELMPLHSYILQELNHEDKLPNLPNNEALSGLCDGMVKAWKIQGNKHAAILFVVENVTYNICDQRFHEFHIRRKHPEVRIIRKTLTQIHEQGSVGANKELIVDGTEVSVVYYRAGYEPNHYPTQKEWDARYLVEKSKAIKCPTINFHLAGTKKVQQALAKPGVLNRFVTDDIHIKAIADIFAGLYSLDSSTEEGKNAFKMALENPERFVLKPQREGGGNNVYGKDIPDALNKMSEVERSAWILMERILPPVTKGYMIRPGGPSPPPLVDLVSELGIFGVIIGDKKAISYNAHCGHMLRTKLENSNEGGVASGFGALDSLYLIDDD